jgi:uncharacterized membrane protein YbhN (UPF0104 family)
VYGTTIVTPAGSAPPAARSGWVWVRGLLGAGILLLLVWLVGTGPFVDGVRRVDGPALIAAGALGALATVAGAWRWRLVVAGYGVRLPLRGAVAAYYRSQFLNTTLPGGVVGDVHRAVRHGRDIGDVGLGVRAAVLDRVVGQVVQAAVAVFVLFAVRSPVRSAPAVVIGLAAAGLLVAAFVLVVVPRRLARGAPGPWLVALRANWLPMIGLSIVVIVGHVATFLLAARTAGSTAPVTRLVPLTLLALVAMALPLNIAGWGPREGVAAWAFAAAGLTAAQGVATAVCYGVLVFVACLPGAGVLLWRWLRADSSYQQGGVHG